MKEKDIYIWGFGKYGKNIKRILNEGDRVKAYIDKKAGETPVVDGIPAYSPDEFLDKYASENNCVVISVMEPTAQYEIFDMIKESSVGSIGVVKRNLGGIFWVKNNNKIYNFISYIEMHIIDGCNLNCKGCTHFSSLYGKDTVVALPDFERDLKQLREKIDMLLRFRLLGGEPLLVPNVGEYIEVARRIFPESEIEVVTNGLPLPNMEKSFFDAVRKNEVMISISAYKPTMKIKDGIISALSRNNVMFRFTNDNIDVFHRNLTLKKIHDESVSWKKCNSSRCIFFRHGKIYKCPIAGMIKEFGEHYNVPFEVDDGIDIYEDALDTCEKVKRLALHPVEACKYCAEDMELIPWQTLNKPELKDWLYHDGENA